jgi:hypothetical protein
MLDGSYPSYYTQEHRPSTYRSAGTSERAAASRVPAQLLRTRQLRSNNRRTMAQKTRSMESNLAGRLQALLEHLGITTAPWYRIKEFPRSGRVEFKAITDIFFRSRILCRHKGPAFRTSRSDAVADAAWQAITSWVCSNKSWLQNSVHYLLPYRKKDQFKAYGVKKDIPRMEMVHHQDVAVELSTRLLTAQHEI